MAAAHCAAQRGRVMRRRAFFCLTVASRSGALAALTWHTKRRLANPIQNCGLAGQDLASPQIRQLADLVASKHARCAAVMAVTVEIHVLSTTARRAHSDGSNGDRPPLRLAVAMPEVNEADCKSQSGLCDWKLSGQLRVPHAFGRLIRWKWDSRRHVGLPAGLRNCGQWLAPIPSRPPAPQVGEWHCVSSMGGAPTPMGAKPGRGHNDPARAGAAGWGEPAAAVRSLTCSPLLLSSHARAPVCGSRSHSHPDHTTGAIP